MLRIVQNKNPLTRAIAPTRGFLFWMVLRKWTLALKGIDFDFRVLRNWFSGRRRRAFNALFFRAFANVFRAFPPESFFASNRPFTSEFLIPGPPRTQESDGRVPFWLISMPRGRVRCLARLTGRQWTRPFPGAGCMLPCHYLHNRSRKLGTSQVTNLVMCSPP